MRLITSAILTVALIAVTGCSIGQKTIVGKWDCKIDGANYNDGKKDTFEYLSDGTQIINSVPSKSVNLQPVQIAAQWKPLDSNRISSTFDGKTIVTTYKFEGEKLLIKSQTSDDYAVKCDRIK